MPHDRFSRAIPYVAYAVIAFWYCAPLFASPHGLGILDWDQHLFYYASVLKPIVEYGQLPFWNPWYCAGNVLWQNPQIPLLSPALPLAAITSLPLAMKINIALHYWVGLAGMHLLLVRGIGMREPLAAMALSMIAVCSGAMAMHLAVGHSVFLPVLYLPFQLYGLVQAIRTGAMRYVVGASVPLALMTLNGALHAVPMSVAGVGIVSVVAAAALRRVRPIVVGLLVGLLGCAFSAPKLLPVAAFVTSDRFNDARTVIEHPDAMSAEMVLRTYLDRYQNRGLKFDGQRSGWYEYGNYIGGAAVCGMLAGVVLAFAVPGARDRWLGIALATTAVVFLLLSAGEFGPLAPASLARYVPLFSSFRIPSRYTFGVSLFGIAVLGWAWRVASGEGTPRRVVTVVVLTVAWGAALDVASQTREQLRGVFGEAPFTTRFRPGAGTSAPPAMDLTRNAYAPGSPMLHGLFENIDFWGSYESLQLARTAAPDAPFISVDGDGRVSDVRFSPNRVEFSLIAGRSTTGVRLNQNAAPGWSSTLGAVHPSPGGMSVAVAPGTAGRFAFSFTPPGLYAGVGIAALALAAAAFLRHRIIPDV